MFISSNLKKKSLLSLSAVAAVALLSGCGSDGTDGNVDEVTITAVDGYIIGATVKDQNGNTAFKNGDGTYSFVKAPKYPLSARGGTLLDTGESFTGTMYAAQGKVVSPLTTLLTTLDEDGNPTDTLNTATLDKLAAIAGVSADEISKDYMAEGNTAVAKLAQVVQIMNQNKDLMAEFKSNIDSSTATGGFVSVKAIADTAIDKMTAQSKLSNIKAEVYKNILNDVEAFTSNDPATLEAELKDTKVALSNIAAIEVLGGEIGTDADALLTASTLVTIAGNPDSTETLTADQLSTLGASSIITDDATLVTFMTDIIKNGDSINSKAEVITYSNYLESLYLLDTKQDNETDKTTALVTAAAVISGITIAEYQGYELDAILNTATQEVDTYAKLITLIEGLAVIDKPTLTVTPEASLLESVNDTGIKIGDTVATASATFDTAGKSELSEFSLDTTTGDASSFAIDTTTGVITSLVDFDYETKRSYTFTVKVASKLSGDPVGDGSVVSVSEESQIITLNVVDVGDFGISKITYDNKNDADASNDTLNIIFNAKVDEATLAVDKFTVTGAGAIDGSATAAYNSATKTYSITGFTTAMEVNVDADASGISMATSVLQDGSTDAPTTTTADLSTFIFDGNEYGLVKSPDTGVIWLDRNLGASQVATASNDANAYGDLYQWGRLADGHELRTNPSTQNTSTLATDINATAAGSDFIVSANSPYDWTTADNDGALRSARWANPDGSGVCPVGFRLPTEVELTNDTMSATTTDVTNSATAYDSFLKLPAAGNRTRATATLNSVGSGGYYWTSSVKGTNPRNLNFNAADANFITNNRANAFTVRCLKD